MKIHLILALILICAGVPAGAQPDQGQTPTADEIVSNMFARDRAREGVSGGYTGSREYVLENRLLNKRAEMLVSVTCNRSGVKHFDVISEDGWKSANKRVLWQMIETETDNSQPDTRAKARITADNYAFRLIETTPLDGRTAYVIQVIPKRQDKTLFRGRIWVNAEDYALARVEGEPAKNPSFWTRKVEFTQEYQKAGAFWFPVQTTSVTDARVFGRTEVRIRYFDYKPLSAQPANSVDSAMKEAQYAKR
jgi:hypothetical protein